MKKQLFFLFTLITSIIFGQQDNETFSQLKSLEGKWIGTIEYSNQDPKPMNLSYSIKSNGSALVEESNEGGIEMTTIFNVQKNKMLSTHYCGLQNRPVAELVSNQNGIVSLKTNQKLSNLDRKEDTFVGSWKFNLSPKTPDSFTYAYTVIGPEGEVFTAKAELSRVK